MSSLICGILKTKNELTDTKNTYVGRGVAKWVKGVKTYKFPITSHEDVIAVERY